MEKQSSIRANLTGSSGITGVYSLLLFTDGKCIISLEVQYIQIKVDTIHTKNLKSILHLQTQNQLDKILIMGGPNYFQITSLKVWRDLTPQVKRRDLKYAPPPFPPAYGGISIPPPYPPTPIILQAKMGNQVKEGGTGGWGGPEAPPPLHNGVQSKIQLSF